MIACIKSHFPVFRAQYSNSRGFLSPIDFQTNLTRQKLSHVPKKKKSKNLCNPAGVHIILCKKKGSNLPGLTT